MWRPRKTVRLKWNVFSRFKFFFSKAKTTACTTSQRVSTCETRTYRLRRRTWRQHEVTRIYVRLERHVLPLIFHLFIFKSLTPYRLCSSSGVSVFCVEVLNLSSWMRHSVMMSSACHYSRVLMTEWLLFRGFFWGFFFPSSFLQHNKNSTGSQGQIWMLYRGEISSSIYICV